jgi:phosphoserine phosphatase RsbU/P
MMSSTFRHLFLFLGLLAQPLGILRAQLTGPPIIRTPPANFSLITGRAPIAYLAGQWRFQPGDDPHFADPGFDDSHWELLDSYQSWSQQGYKDLSGFAWYRFRVTVPAGDQAFSLLLPAIYTSYQCFIDGELRLATGDFPPRKYMIYQIVPAAVALPTASRRQDKTFTVALRVWHSPFIAGFIGGGPVHVTRSPDALVGPSLEVEHILTYEVRSWRFAYGILLDIGALDLLAAIVSLALYLFRRTEREYLWFGIAVLSNSINLGQQYFALGHISSATLHSGLDIILRVTAALAFLAFYKSLLRVKLTWSLRVAAACLILRVVALVLVTLGLIGYGAENFTDALLTLPFEIWVLALLIQRARQRIIDARLLLVPVFLVSGINLASGVTVALTQFGHPPTFNILSFRIITSPLFVTAENLAEIIFLVAMLAILLNRFARTSRERDRSASELEAARSLQQVLIPETLPLIPGFAIATAYHPAQEVGGDFFQILPLASGETMVILGDVSGKGLTAAMTVSFIVGVVRSISVFTNSPSGILSALNSQLHGRGSGFTTCLALRISANGTVVLSNAAQLAPYLNGSEVLTEFTLPLGLDPDAVFSEVTLHLVAGDRLTLLTDGVPEAMCRRELFGFARTEELSKELANVIADTAIRFGQTDDITVLSINFA